MADIVHASSGNLAKLEKALKKAKLTPKDKMSLALQVIGILGSWGIQAYLKTKKDEVPKDHDSIHC